MKNDLIKKISASEFSLFSSSKKSNEWPFKRMLVGDAIEISAGYNGKTVEYITQYARVFNNSSKKEFEINVVKKKDGSLTVQVLRTK